MAFQNCFDAKEKKLFTQNKKTKNKKTNYLHKT